MSRIFISHSSRDNAAATALRDWMKAEGWDEVFLDLDPRRGIVAGERWERALHEAASRCEAVVFLVSRNWLASQWCDREYALARGLNKTLLAVLVDPDLALVELPEKYKATWQVVDLMAGQDHRVFRVPQEGSHEEAHVAFSQAGLTRLRRGLEKAGLDPKFFAWPPAAEPTRAPYRGLKPLEAEDAGIFFGRGAPIVEASDRLRGLAAGAAPRLLVLLGASGAGKSSFLRAGLLPRLARDDAHFLPLAPIRPGSAALTGDTGLLGALAKALPGHPLGDLRAALAAGAATVRPLLAGLAEAAFRRALGETAGPPAVVVAIDQAEELFRPEGAAEGAALLALLRELTATDDPAVIVIFAIRSDSYDALEHAKPLEGLRQATLPLLPMPRGAYADVIEGPPRRIAEAGGRLAVEPRLTQRLLEDIEKGGGSDALPLLAFTLEQLWLECRGTGALRLADYEGQGGLRGAIDKAVARAFTRADADGRIPRERAAREALLRRGLIPWLAGIDPDTRSPRRNIARQADIPAEAAPLIALLVEERLLSTDVKVEDAGGVETRTGTIEPTHEALLRQWGLLEGWLQEDFGRLATLEGVQRAARDWEANARGEAWLAHGGERLAAAQALDERADIAAKLDAMDRAYLARCRAREAAARAEAEARRVEREAEQMRRLADARKLTRVTAAGLVAALVLAAAAGGSAWWARAEKVRADAAAATAAARTREALRQQSLAISAADELVTAVSQKLAPTAGFASWKILEVLGDAERIADLVSSGDPDNPALVEGRIHALEEEAEADFAMSEPDKAYRELAKAEDLLSKLAKTKGPIEARSFQEEALEDAGDAARQQHKFAIAASDFQAALSRADQDALGRLRRLRKLAETQMRAADWASDSSLAALTPAIGTTQAALSIERPGHIDTIWKSEIGQIVGLQADLDTRLTDFARAIAAYNHAISLYFEIAREKPFDVGVYRMLGELFQRLGDAQRKNSDLGGAIKSYEQARIWLRRTTDSNPGDMMAQMSVDLLDAGERRLKEKSENYHLVSNIEKINKVDQDFGIGLKPFQFGMTPAEVAALFKSRVSVAAMPLAGEFRSGQVYYLWRWLYDLPDTTYFHHDIACSIQSGYMTFLFSEEKLFEVSIRFLQNPKCPQNNEILDRFAKDYGLDITSSPSEKRVSFSATRVSIVAMTTLYALDIGFIGR